MLDVIFTLHKPQEFYRSQTDLDVIIVVYMNFHNQKSGLGLLDESSVSPFDRTPKVSGLLSDGHTAPESITVLLSRVSGGDRKAFDQLIPLVYHELHRITEGYVRRESQTHVAETQLDFSGLYEPPLGALGKP